MFDKYKFRDVLANAKGDRTNEDYAKASGVSRAYISGYMNARIDSPPSPEILKRFAANSRNNVTYDDLMSAAGYLGSAMDLRNYLEGNPTPKEQAQGWEIFKQMLVDAGLIKAGEEPSVEMLSSVVQIMKITAGVIKKEGDKRD